MDVALSRAKSKLIVITTNEMLKPENIENFANKKISEGLAFLQMVKKWVKAQKKAGSGKAEKIKNFKSE